VTVHVEPLEMGRNEISLINVPVNVDEILMTRNHQQVMELAGKEAMKPLAETD